MAGREARALRRRHDLSGIEDILRIECLFRLRDNGKHWQAWVDWYDYVLEGSPPATQQDDDWETAFVDIPQPLPWGAGAESVNAEIAVRLRTLIPLRGEIRRPNEAETQKPSPKKTRRKLQSRTKVGKAVAANQEKYPCCDSLAYPPDRPGIRKIAPTIAQPPRLNRVAQSSNF
jgi:hypothetical protein